MIKPDDGGFAFPFAEATTDFSVSPGMTLRDWFAGQALPACLAAPCPPAWANGSVEHRIQSVAAAYLIADAMIASRNNLP
jgi:hypothetical protein